VLGVLAAFSRHAEALEWARCQAVREWGPPALVSPVFAFVETRFYDASMGPELQKQLLAFERLMDPAELAARKLRANEWEDECRAQHAWPEPRPVNLDPGYLTEAKLILASTKDRDHRIYLEHGIFAEGTLYFHHGQWCARPWTYPDYQRSDYHQFFTVCREYLRTRYRSEFSPTAPTQAGDSRDQPA
jgi:hypothetical protein